MDKQNIRNFAIIAHINHGKSTLADRIMEQVQTVKFKENQSQILDDMEVEKAHGVTVKSRTVRNMYQADDGQEYELNFIDTPGHVDFSYEVSKSLAACDGVILLVDCTKGVQAQTVANFRLAKQNNLKIIPVINKIDTNPELIERTEKQIRNLDSMFEKGEILKISAKTGKNVHAVLESIVDKVPSPMGEDEKRLKALIFDSQYNPYKGVIAYVRIFEGILEGNENIIMMQKNNSFQAHEVGIFTPVLKEVDTLHAGDIGYIVTGLKDPNEIRVGDTITRQTNPTEKALPGYKPAQPMVYAGIYPKGNNYANLKAAIQKLALNDSSFHFKEEVSDALGPGFRCNFLGIFHLKIIRERLLDEFGIQVLTTSPNITYQVHLKNGEDQVVVNPSEFPYFVEIESVKEPYVKATIQTPYDMINDVMKLATKHRGELLDMGNIEDLIELTYKLPVAEVAYDFFNQLKSISHGFVTLSTEFLDYELADAVKIEILVNYAKVDALTFVANRQKAIPLAQEIVHQLKYVIPRKLYPMPTQAIIEGRTIARVDVPPLRKNAAINGSNYNVSKKQALLRRQNINKRKAAQSDIELPQKVFDTILNLNL